MKYESLSSRPLYVDLDGTLIKGDLLWESYFRLLKMDFFAAIKGLWELRKGISNFKAFVAKQVTVASHTLPFRQEVIRYIQQRKEHGARVILATASPESWAHSVAIHLNLFDGVLASNEAVNLKGARKLEAIEADSNGDFDYIGDSRADLPIWGKATEPISIASRFAQSQPLTQKQITIIGDDSKTSKLALLLKVIRPHQWVKNVLIATPLIFAHKINDLVLLEQSAFGFLSFSFCASAVYVLNDALDINEDRGHRTKKNRPFASGALPLWLSPLLAGLLFFAGLSITSSFLPRAFLVILLGYVSLTFAYSLYLKQLLLWDVIALAALYTIRIIAGGSATNIFISPWLLSFSIFMFFGLALLKRYIEIKSHGDQSSLGGRDYSPGDLQIVQTFGICASMLSTVILALYLSSDKTMTLYRNPEFLWPIVMIMFLWNSRIWLLAHRGKVDSDPVLFAIKDQTSYLLGFLAAMNLFWAI